MCCSCCMYWLMAVMVSMPVCYLCVSLTVFLCPPCRTDVTHGTQRSSSLGQQSTGGEWRNCCFISLLPSSIYSLLSALYTGKLHLNTGSCTGMLNSPSAMLVKDALGDLLGMELDKGPAEPECVQFSKSFFSLKVKILTDIKLLDIMMILGIIN